MFNKNKLDTLSEKWKELKEEEKRIKKERENIENLIFELMEVDDKKEGTETIETDNNVLSVRTRLNRKVDGEKLQLLARENGLPFDILSTLFRWKAEVELKNWRNADCKITDILKDAITEKPAKPSIIVKERETV